MGKEIRESIECIEYATLATKLTLKVRGQNMQCIVLLLIVFMFLFPFWVKAQTTNIIMVDVSGSMSVYGYGSSNILPEAKRQLEHFITLSSENGWKTEVYPFASVVYVSDSPRLVVRRGNTNIYKAILYAQSRLQTGRNNIYLITDGVHNVSPSIDDLCAKLTEIKSFVNDSTYYYYVAIGEKARKSKIAQVFDGQDNFFLLDSLYVPEIMVTKPVSSCRSKINKMGRNIQDNKTSEIAWLPIVLSCVIVLLLILVWHFLPAISSAISTMLQFILKTPKIGGRISKTWLKEENNVGSSETSKKQSEKDKKHSSKEESDQFRRLSIKEKMQQLQAMTNHIYELPLDLQEEQFNKLDPKMREKIEQCRKLQMGRLPSDAKGTWSGERGNSTFRISDDYIWKDSKTKVSMSVKEWREMYGIKEPIEIQYTNGEPDFGRNSIVETKVVYEEDYNYRDIEVLHNPVNENLKRELSPSLLDRNAYDPVRDYVENAANDGTRCRGCRNTYHEKRDGETVQVVPDFIHAICTHNGGRSFATLVQKW